MTLHTLTGTIERRMLINYRVDPEVAASVLPEPFAPSLVDGFAIAGICLIELSIRPAWLPRRMAFRSINGAHRVAVTLPDETEAVYIPRRDTNSRLSAIAGGRLFPGTHHLAAVDMVDDGTRFEVDLASRDASTHVSVTASITDRIPSDSVFSDLADVSDFFERGSLGYSETPQGGCYDGIELRAQNWSVTPLTVQSAISSFFDDETRFPAGSAVLDNALLMRGIDLTCHSTASLPATASLPVTASLPTP